MSNRNLSSRFRKVLATLVLILPLVCAVMASAGKPGKTVAANARHAQSVAPDVVNSQTIYDDGDGSSDIFFYPPVTTGGSYQDDWMLVRGDIVSTTPPPPFDIETLSYYLRQNWNGSAGTVAIWDPGSLTAPQFIGDDNSITIGFNNVTLPTPLTIPSAGTGVFWMGIWQSFAAASPATECTTCRVAGVDNVGVIGPNVGFYNDIDASGDYNDISGAKVALGSNRVPIIRAGITATDNTVPVELIEFAVE